MAKVMYESLESQAILQRMEEVRCDLDEDVQEIVEGTRVMGKWRYYVKTYPWICLGAALAVGYLIVPRRTGGMQPDTETLAELANQSHLLATSHLSSKGKVRGILLPLAGNLVMRAVSAYVGQQAGKLFATHTAKSTQDAQP